MAEGAALEMPCTGNCTVGSNPTPSANQFHKRAVQNLVFRCRGARSMSVGEKGSAARRRRKAAREAYFLYVERAADGANEADDPLSPTDASGRARWGGSGAL